MQINYLIGEKMIDISVIIPIYNSETYLNQCIISALPREGQNIELILVDDGSTDNSATLCDHLQKKYPKLIKVIHKANGGLSDARNTGIANASGRYLMFLDSDDMFADGLYDWIIKQLDFGYDIIEFDCLYCKNRRRISTKRTTKFEVLSATDEIERLLKNKIGDQICRRAYKRELFRNIKFPMDKSYEDMFTYYKIVLNSKSILTTKSQYYIYYISNSMSITNTISGKNMTDMFEAINKKCQDLTQFCTHSNINVDYIEYYKRFHYTYIYYKIKKYNLRSKCSKLDTYLRNYLRNNNNYNFIKNKDYIFNSSTLLKTWIYYEVNHLFGLV